MKRAATVMLVAVVAPWTASCAPSQSAVTFDPGVPADVRALARGTWHRFLAAFPARTDCIEPVTVGVAWNLSDRAAYHPGLRRVTLRVPGTAPNLTATLLHEYAHHLEFTCPEVRAVRPAFRSAQGLPDTGGWFRGPTWETTPSEHFAEAVARFVLGAPPAHQRVAVSDEALAAVRAWARGT